MDLEREGMINEIARIQGELLRYFVNVVGKGREDLADKLEAQLKANAARVRKNMSRDEYKRMMEQAWMHTGFPESFLKKMGKSRLNLN